LYLKITEVEIFVDFQFREIENSSKEKFCSVDFLSLTQKDFVGKRIIGFVQDLEKTIWKIKF